MPEPRDVLVMWTITYNTADFPGRYVVRGHDIGAGASRPHAMPLAVCDTLEQARAEVPPGLLCTARDPSDDPVIVESWF